MGTLREGGYGMLSESNAVGRWVGGKEYPIVQEWMAE